MSAVRSQAGAWAMVPVWVLSKGLTGGELATYVSLRSFADRSGEAHPSFRTVAERAGLSVKTVEKAVSRLRDLGLLRTTRRYRPDGSIAGCDYVLVDVDPAPEPPTQDVRSGDPEDRPSGDPSGEPEGSPPGEPHRPDVERLCALMADLVEGNGAKRPAITEAWRRDARLLLDRDGRVLEKAEELMRWAAADQFWRSNVLSIPTFRKQYERLRLKALAEWEARNRPAATRPNSAENRLAKARQIAADLLARQEQQQAPALATPNYLQITNGSDQ